MPICDPARDGSSSSSSGSSCKRQSRDPTTGRGDSCTNMNINTTPRRQATPTTSLGSDRTGEGLPRLDKRERAVSRRALEGQRQQRAEQQPQQQQRAAVPRPVKDRGDSGASPTVTGPARASLASTSASARSRDARSKSSDSSARSSSSSCCSERQSRDPSRIAEIHART
jgi:hypothetical protein